MLVRRWLKRDEGSAAVEFAIIAPVFFLLVFAIFETSLFYFKRHSLRYLVFEVSRELQTGHIQKAGDPETLFKETVCEKSSFLFDCDDIFVDVRAFNRLSDATFPPITFDGDGEPSNFTFDPGRQEQIMIVRAVTNFSFITPMIKSIFQPDGENVIITGASITKNEAFGCTGEC
ncbi:TadE/TadG family type IV pilus assembly protein [Parvularcula sp. LCG005]|uniref:TadE/TadG family type IV pilus assembly protein n=1 Tax=Parvularcula sp. LCG005 TaxID=3078805 RepID=UPI002941EF7D|nr:TadE/TadG family type IV pilus assembly protein [Parvularcula sp. LCG005]WOI54030.1 TadE/TadG family type IV pilus assembly protein [Parvularcula sp. LCG005]